MSDMSSAGAVYKVIGYQTGKFNAQDGTVVNYTTIFAVTPIGEDREGYHGVGDKAHILKCANADVLKQVSIGLDCYLFFNKYQKVTMVMPVK